MRKLLLAVLILVMIAVPSAYADDEVTVDLIGGVKANSGLGNQIGIGFETWGGSSAFVFSIGLDAEADIFFNENHGMYVGAGFNFGIGSASLGGLSGNGTTIAYSVDVGYAYKTYFDDFDLVVTAGPHVTGISNAGNFGVECDVYLDFYFARDWFMRAGAGLTMDFLLFNPGGATGGFSFMITGPYLGFGYSF